MKRDKNYWLSAANNTVYVPGQKAGHYESYFLRANHPSRPLAFWIRYTIFSPQGSPDKAIGELWAVYFNGETGANTAVKKEVPFAQCSFSPSALDVEIGKATLNSGRLAGGAAANNHDIYWDMEYGGDQKPLFLLPLNLYAASFPRAKSCVPLPLAEFTGILKVDGRDIKIDKWVGSQNHNWGSKHTDLYAWGQVAGFDSNPGSFLEVATARLKLGPFWTPAMTPIVLRHKGEEFALNDLSQTVFAHGRFIYFDWQFGSEDGKVGLAGRIWADRDHFVGLNYYNPPGGNKHCLNTKIASCYLRLTYRRGLNKGVSEMLTTNNRAAFEILTDDDSHSVAIL